ncbi:porin [Vibrio sp. SCSIO 43137]|uniref:porin n=1 Tax=Vibrio sp. SCSIO 43137 TaxID=3021011 RepID=UPI002307F64E|nr:porin [Vibrio sp. SCSIO 43137]WCE28807.1 hypothetical protein PK654_10595 [Vibrio sp. SCSIO 43137]
MNKLKIVASILCALISPYTLAGYTDTPDWQGSRYLDINDDVTLIFGMRANLAYTTDEQINQDEFYDNGSRLQGGVDYKVSEDITLRSYVEVGMDVMSQMRDFGDDEAPGLSRNHAYAEVKSDWGNLSIGHQYYSQYNLVTYNTDWFQVISGNASSYAPNLAPSGMVDSIKYIKSFDNLNIGLDYAMQDKKGFGVSMQYMFSGRENIGLAYTSVNKERDDGSEYDASQLTMAGTIEVGSVHVMGLMNMVENYIDGVDTYGAEFVMHRFLYNGLDIYGGLNLVADQEDTSNNDTTWLLGTAWYMNSWLTLYVDGKYSSNQSLGVSWTNYPDIWESGKRSETSLTLGAVVYY